MTSRNYTLDKFRAAVDDPTVETIADLCRAIGIVARGANYESVRAFAQLHDIDLSRLRRRQSTSRASYTDAELEEALTAPGLRGYADVCRLLGLKPLHNTYRRIRAHAERLGIDVPSWWSRKGVRYKGGIKAGCWFDHGELGDALKSAPSLAAALRHLGEPVNATSYNRLSGASSMRRSTCRTCGPRTAAAAPRGDRSKRSLSAAGATAATSFVRSWSSPGSSILDASHVGGRSGEPSPSHWNSTTSTATAPTIA